MEACKDQYSSSYGCDAFPADRNRCLHHTLDYGAHDLILLRQFSLQYRFRLHAHETLDLLSLVHENERRYRRYAEFLRNLRVLIGVDFYDRRGYVGGLR